MEPSRATSPFLAALQGARALLASAASSDGRTSSPPDPSEAALARKITRELDQAISRLQGNDNEKDLVAIICHDLKDPLASVVMGAGFLRKAIAGEDTAARRVVDAIARSADRMSSVVGDFHDLAKLESARLGLEIGPYDVVAVLRPLVSTFAAQASDRAVQFEAELPDAPLIALCDRVRVAQIAGKLIGNALRFTPRGGRVNLRAEGVTSGVRITVADTGRGISTDRLPTIFDYAANARRTPRDGAGLGLAIVRGLVECQRGSVEAESGLDEGSKFSFTLPVPVP